jgi:lysozyme family protein
VLGVSIVWDAPSSRYRFVDELGNVTRPESIAGYEANYWKRITTESMSAVQQSYTAYQRAVIDGDKLAESVYRKRQRSFVGALQTFSAEAEMVGSSTEHDRIEAFIKTVVRL